MTTDLPSAPRFRLEVVEYGKLRLTDGAEEKVIDADLETGRGRGSLLLAATMLLGNTAAVIAKAHEAATALRSGALAYGPTVAELQREARRVAWAADHPGEPMPYEPFPVSVLPKTLADLVSDGARALGCDEAQIALPMLAACSAAIGNSRRIILKTSWIEPALIWTVIILPSGNLKSPAMDLALEPIRAAQRKAIAEYRAELTEYQARHDAWEDEPKRGRGAEPIAPQCVRIKISDITIEAVADRLQFARRGLLCERDELAGWVKGFNQYKAKGGADLTHWLAIFGARELMMDRKTGDQKLIYCPRAFVAVTGTIQPGTLRSVLTPEYRESGLAARLLAARPPVRRRQWSEATVREVVKDRYAKMLAKLMALPMSGDPMDPEPVDVPMTPEAKAAWIAFYNAHNLAEQASEGGDLAAAWNKIEGYAARLALVIHMVRVVSNMANPAAVDAVSMAAGIALAQWFAGEAERVYAMLGGDGEQDELGNLTDLIREHGGRITARELSRASRAYRGDGAARDGLCRLVEAGRGRWVPRPPGEHGGRPGEVFELATLPSERRCGHTGDGDKTPCHDSATRGNGTVTTGTANDAVDCVTGEDDQNSGDDHPDETVVPG